MSVGYTDLRRTESTYDDKGANDFARGVMVCHNHSVDEVGCHSKNNDKEDELQDAGDQEGGANGRGSIGWDLHDEKSEGWFVGGTNARWG
jgi:hypothetical protein